MKTIFLFMFLLLLCACTNMNKPLSDAEKSKIKAEVKEVMDAINKAAEEANFEFIAQLWLDSPDFVCTLNGNSYTYKEAQESLKPLLASLKNQKFTLFSENFIVLDNATVVYSNKCKWLVTLKNGQSIQQEPWASLSIFKKVDGKWRIISGTESGVEKSVPNDQQKELNQVELMKKFVGKWKEEIGKDTTFIWEGKAYGMGLDLYVKTETKGKIVSEGKGVLAYDKSSDKYIQARIMKASGSLLAVMWFTSKNICEAVLLKDISNPENAQMKVIFEFISPTKFTQTYKAPNTPDKVTTFTLMNK